MNCPACTNPCKTAWRFYTEPAFLSFKCQWCNTPQRGNALMIFFDFLEFAIIALVLGSYYAVFPLISEYVQEFNVFWIPFALIFVLLMPIKWAKRKYGHFRKIL